MQTFCELQLFSVDFLFHAEGLSPCVVFNFPVPVFVCFFPCAPVCHLLILSVFPFVSCVPVSVPVLVCLCVPTSFSVTSGLSSVFFVSLAFPSLFLSSFLTDQRFLSLTCFPPYSRLCCNSKMYRCWKVNLGSLTTQGV